MIKEKFLLVLHERTLEKASHSQDINALKRLADAAFEGALRHGDSLEGNRLVAIFNAVECELLQTLDNRGEV